MRVSSFGRAAIAVVSVCGLIMPAPAAPTASQTPPKAKITPKQAETAAVRKLGGKASPAKYEFEDGHWQYAVVVTNSKGMYEAEVSSTTGKVTAVEKTTSAEEAKEAAADKKKAEMSKMHGSKNASTMKAEKGESGEKGEKNEKGE